MGFSPQQTAFISTLANRTGLNPGVVASWVALEEPVGAHSSFHGTQNWLNVGITDSGPMGAGNSIWRDPNQAAIATANWIKGSWADPGFGHAAPGIQRIVHTAGQSPQAQIAAIRNSGWASSGYPDFGSVYSQYAGFRPSGVPAAPGRGQAGMPQMGIPGSPPLSSPMVIPTSTFNRGAYNADNARYIAGSFVSQLDKNNPYDIPVKGEMQSSDPLLSSGALLTSAPDPANYVTQGFKIAQNTLQGIAGTAPLKVHPGVVAGRSGGYVNPIKGFTLSRTDQGVDASARPGTPIRAIGDSKVADIVPDWYHGQPLYLFQFLNGPKAGQYWYVSEQISPRVGKGQVVHAGDTVATFAPSGTGIEIGYGDPRTSHRTLATAPGHGGYVEGQVTPEGSGFRQFLGSLGAR